MPLPAATRFWSAACYIFTEICRKMARTMKANSVVSSVVLAGASSALRERSGFGSRPEGPARPYPPAALRLTPEGQLAATNQLRLAIGLPLRDPASLDRFLAQAYDPASPSFHQFLTLAELHQPFWPHRTGLTSR